MSITVLDKHHLDNSGDSFRPQKKAKVERIPSPDLEMLASTASNLLTSPPRTIRRVTSDGTMFSGQLDQVRNIFIGKIASYNGLIHEGKFKNGQLEGSGEETLLDGSTYEGEFHQGLKQGWGISTFLNGSIYEGYWQNNRWHGQGKVSYSNGATREGEFERGELKTGLETHPSGRSYEGQFKEGKLHGYGKMTAPDGNVTEGQWENGVLVK